MMVQGPVDLPGQAGSKASVKGWPAPVRNAEQGKGTLGGERRLDDRDTGMSAATGGAGAKDQYQNQNGDQPHLHMTSPNAAGVEPPRPAMMPLSIQPEP